MMTPITCGVRSSLSRTQTLIATRSPLWRLEGATSSGRPSTRTRNQHWQTREIAQASIPLRGRSELWKILLSKSRQKHATKNQFWRRISLNFGSYQSLLTSLPAAVIAAIAGKDIIAANLERNHPKFEDGTGSGSSRRRSFDKFHRHSSEGYVNERQGTAEKSNHLYHTSYQYVMYVCMYVIFV